MAKASLAGMPQVLAAKPKIVVPLACINSGRRWYLTATHGRLPAQVSEASAHTYVALQAGARLLRGGSSGGGLQVLKSPWKITGWDSPAKRCGRRLEFSDPAVTRRARQFCARRRAARAEDHDVGKGPSGATNHIGSCLLRGGTSSAGEDRGHGINLAGRGASGRSAQPARRPARPGRSARTASSA